MAHFFGLMAVIGCILLAGCGPNWHNPNLKDQSKSAEQLEKDRTYCEKWAQDQVDTAPRNDDFNIGITPFQRMTNYQTDLMYGSSRISVYNQCMRSRGWKDK